MTEEIKGIHLKATFAGLRVDKEGQAKITFTIPLSNQTEALGLATLIDTVVDLSVTPEQKQKKF